MSTAQSKEPNPKRVAAGAHNRARRGPLTEQGRQRLREAILRTRPWEHSTGPRTAEGRARASANGKKRQLGPRSIREIRADLADLRELLRSMRESRSMAAGPPRSHHGQRRI